MAVLSFNGVILDQFAQLVGPFNERRILFLPLLLCVQVDGMKGKEISLEQVFSQKPSRTVMDHLVDALVDRLPLGPSRLHCLNRCARASQQYGSGFPATNEPVHW